MGRNLTAALLALAMTSCGISGAPTPLGSTGEDQLDASMSAQPSPEDDQHVAAGLALVRFPDADSPLSQVFVVEPDGSIRQVTGLGAQSPGASWPTWSPDRSQIAFNPPKVGAGPSPQVGIVDADGTGERAIGPGANPRWSPDGSRLVFEDMGMGTGGTGEPLAMWMADLGTGEVTRIGIGSSPRWLPDGTQISFHAWVEGKVPGEPQAVTEVLYIMSLDGGEPQEFAIESDARWSPDGSAVLLVHEGVLSLADPDGSNAHELVGGYDPVWSPDGTRILFAYDLTQDGLPILALVDRDGRELWSGVVGSSPTWSPDGTRLAVEIAYPQPVVQVLDAGSGEVLWETEGTQPAWAG